MTPAGIAHQVSRLNAQVLQLHQQGQYQAALELARQACTLACQQLGEDHPDATVSLNNLGGLLRATGHLAEAKPYYEKALAIRRRLVGEEHPGTALCLNNLGTLLHAMGDLAGAQPCFERALAIRRKTLGEEHADTAQSYNNLGALLRAQGDPAGAQRYYEQALVLYCRALGEEHPSTATSFNNLGFILQMLGDLAGARRHYERTLAIRRKVLGEEHPDTAQILSNLGSLLQAMGDLPGAQAHYERALAIQRRLLGEDHPLTATSINNLAHLFQAQHNLAEARFYCERALAIRRKVLGDAHPDTAQCVNNLGYLLQALGDVRRSRAAYEQALATYRKVLGDEHPDTARCLNNLGALLRRLGDLAGARAYCERALAIRRKVLGDEHPDTALCLYNLALLSVAQGQAEQAFDLLEQVVRIDDRMIGQVFAVGSESQRVAFLVRTQSNLDLFLSLVACQLAALPRAVATALDVVLRRKALLAEALAAQRDALLGGAYPDLRSRLEEWAALRMRIGRKTLAGPGPEGLEAHRRQLAAWHEERERLEAELAQQVPEMNLEKKLRAADRRAIAQALPEGAALVEFVRVSVFDLQAVAARGEGRWLAPRYLAFVLGAGDPASVAMIDLGDAAALDRQVADFRTRIVRVVEEAGGRDLVRHRHDEAPPTRTRFGLSIRRAVFDRLLPALGGRRRLLLAPDGDLTRLPWEVLPTAGDRRLIDDYQISYVNTGRDVLRFSAPVTRQRAEPLVVADPDFDLAAPGHAAAGVSTRAAHCSRDLHPGELHFNRLPGTRAEGERIAALLGVRPWQEAAALEGRLKARCRSPRILHLATHGFFLENQKPAPGQPDLLAPEEGGRLAGPLPENPLLRAGLALAGANTWLRNGPLPDEAEDGLLTAEDVSGLDLLGTELVVLSACETGLGEVRTGEGVFGLQRAFTLAGARTLIMSLWSVPDEPTRELMENLYRRILAGEPRANALHHAQLDLRRKYPDPYYWGAFICQGNPGPLE